MTGTRCWPVDGYEYKSGLVSATPNHAQIQDPSFLWCKGVLGGDTDARSDVPAESTLEGTGKGKGDGGGDGCRRTIFWDMTTGGMYECAAPPPLFDRPPPICCSKDCATPPMVPE